jgi:Na+/H+ antiporter NhaD/arsenite permease-like protein
MRMHALRRPEKPARPDAIASRRDRLGPALAVAATVLSVAAVVFATDRLQATVAGTGPAFVVVALVIAGGWIADRSGLFLLAGRVMSSNRIPATVAPATVLLFAALLSGLVNLDVAAVVAPPIALLVATRRGLDAGRLVVATAITTNAASTLMPWANVTTLLILGRSSLSLPEYVQEGWLAWILATTVTVTSLSATVGMSSGPPKSNTSSSRIGRLWPALIDLVLMFGIATAVWSLLGPGVAIPGEPLAQVFEASLLAAGANNLPAAAALTGTTGNATWNDIWAMAMGPNLLLTGSVATIICRRALLDRGVAFHWQRFTFFGAMLLPIQLAVANLGLHLVSR